MMKFRTVWVPHEHIPGAHIVEHWHDGVMVEANFVDAPCKWKVLQAVGEQAHWKGHEICWISAAMKAKKMADNRKRRH